MRVGFVVFVFLVIIAVVAVAIYRNNQKKAEEVISKVEEDATKVVNDVKKI